MQFLTAKNFKSLVDFRLDLEKFNCLIGLNGAGKSTVLQFIDFVGQQVRGKIDGWLAEREWEAKDITSKLTSHPTVDFGVSLVADTGEKDVTWEARFDPSKLHCTFERIATPGGTLDVENGYVHMIDPTGNSPGLDAGIAFSYQGSILSQLDDERLPESLLGFKKYFTTVKSFDVLTPQLLRKRTREVGGGLGLGGQRLASLVDEISLTEQRELVLALQTVYPQLVNFYAQKFPGGWKQIEIEEAPQGQESFPRITTGAQHINDGMLRLIAIVAELASYEQRFVLFDEIENGINPEVVEFVIDKLVNARQQVMVTTHSPMILNYLDDQVARDGVVYLYKARDGRTRAIRFFDVPSIAEKLTVMGPGEAFADTDLTALRDEIEAVTEGQ
jgi:ABC-type branched-subunit amino acid transport system ATPase component